MKTINITIEVSNKKYKKLLNRLGTTEKELDKGGKYSWKDSSRADLFSIVVSSAFTASIMTVIRRAFKLKIPK